MRIAVMGTGGVGGYFGARLALAGNDVTFVARGKHLEAIRRDGLRVASESTPMHVRDAKATDEPASIGPVDTVMFCVKLWDIESAAEAIRPLLGNRGVAIPFQNGIDSPGVLTRVLGADRVATDTSFYSREAAAPAAGMWILEGDLPPFAATDNGALLRFSACAYLYDLSGFPPPLTCVGA